MRTTALLRRRSRLIAFVYVGHVHESTAILQRSIIGVEIGSYAVTLRQVSDVFCVCDELNRAKDRALRHTAV